MKETLNKCFPGHFPSVLQQVANIGPGHDQRKTKCLTTDEHLNEMDVECVTKSDIYFWYIGQHLCLK